MLWYSQHEKLLPPSASNVVPALAPSPNNVPEPAVVDILFDPYLSVNRAKELSTMARRPKRPKPRVVAGGPRAGCKRVQWFTALGIRYGIKKQADLYKRMLRAALVSKMFNAPSLVPNIIYDGDPDDFTAWWEAQGGRVHYHNLTFYDKIKAAYAADGRLKKQWLTQYGAYMRMDLPYLLAGSTPPPDVEAQYVLYTDVDVLFLNDIDSCTIEPPRHVRMGAEIKRGEIVNSGIMYINMPAFAANISSIVQWGVDHKFPGVLDQTILLEFYKADLDMLPDIFNWKGYWGGDTAVTIVHFHGPKPGRCLECFVMYSPVNMTDICIGKGGKCSAYVPLFMNAPDGGHFYEKVLLLFYTYLSRSYA
jgi:hypothetical protein